MATLGNLSKTDLRLLAVFMTVSEVGGFAPAQVELNVSQSSISRQISDLEARLGVRLCQRGRVGFRLTEKGQAVYDAAKRLFGSLEVFRREVGALKGALVGNLSIAVIDNWVSSNGDPLSGAIRLLKQEAPQVSVSLSCLAPDSIEKAVLDGHAELGIGVFHQHRPGLVYEQLLSDPMELFCGKGHPLYDALSSETDSLILAADYVRRAYLSEEQVAPQTSNLRSTASAHQMEAVAFLILSGAHIGYMPVAYANRWSEIGMMRSINPAKYRTETKIETVMRRGSVPGALARQFLSHVRAAAGQT